MPYAEFSHIKMHYAVKGQGEPVILIAGIASDYRYFSKLADFLADSFTVAVNDNRGTGLTEYNGDFEWQDLVDDIDGLVTKLGWEKFHVLGWSMGSQIAMEYTVQHQDKVNSLTVISAYERCPARSSYMMNSMIECGLRGGDVKYAYAMLNAFGLTENFFDSMREKERPVKVMPRGTNEMFRQQMHCLDTFDLRGKIPSITVPVFSIHGIDDIMVEQKLGDRIASQLKDCEILRIPDVGHIIRPELYQEELKRFLLAHPIE